jgi:hypothetical protein
MPESRHHPLLGGLLGRKNLEFLTKAARERQYNRQEREEVQEAQWNVKTFDWPLSHPDDVSDDDGFRLLGSEAYLLALRDLDGSFDSQPVSSQPGSTDGLRMPNGGDTPA